MATLHRHKIKADGARLRTFGPDPMAQSLFGVFRHQNFQLDLGPLMIEEGGAGRAEQASKLCPRVGPAHIDNPNRGDRGPRRLDAEGSRNLARLDAAPEPSLGR
jgi:hypothetical protein